MTNHYTIVNQMCSCGHSIDEHIESDGEQTITGECRQCSCPCYSEDEE